MPIELDKTEEIFAASQDLTVGLEEEFAVLDPRTLDLVPRFEELRDAAAATDPVLFSAITGELISSEIEIISGVGGDLAGNPGRSFGHGAGGKPARGHHDLTGPGHPLVCQAVIRLTHGIS